MDKIRESNEKKKTSVVDLSEFSKKENSFVGKTISQQSSCSIIKHDTSITDIE